MGCLVATANGNSQRRDDGRVDVVSERAVRPASVHRHFPRGGHVLTRRVKQPVHGASVGWPVALVQVDGPKGRDVAARASGGFRVQGLGFRV